MPRRELLKQSQPPFRQLPIDSRTIRPTPAQRQPVASYETASNIEQAASAISVTSLMLLRILHNRHLACSGIHSECPPISASRSLQPVVQRTELVPSFIGPRKLLAAPGHFSLLSMDLLFLHQFNGFGVPSSTFLEDAIVKPDQVHALLGLGRAIQDPSSCHPVSRVEAGYYRRTAFYTHILKLFDFE